MTLTVYDKIIVRSSPDVEGGQLLSHRRHDNLVSLDKVDLHIRFVAVYIVYIAPEIASESVSVRKYVIF